MKKIVAFCLVFCFVICLCGCKGKEDAKNNESQNVVSVSNTVSDVSVISDSSDTSSDSNSSAPSQKYCAHDYAPATCTAPITCKKCGATSGKALEHKWIPATCKELKSCSVCKKIEGELGEHDYSKGRCKVCNKKDPEYGLLTSHLWEVFKSKRLITISFENCTYSESVMTAYSELSDQMKEMITNEGGESKLYVSGGTKWFPTNGDGFAISYKEEKDVVTVVVTEDPTHSEDKKKIIFKRVGENKLKVTKCELKGEFWKLAVGDVLTLVD